MDQEPQRPKPTGSPLLAAGIGLATAVALGVGAWMMVSRPAPPPPAPPPPPPAAAPPAPPEVAPPPVPASRLAELLQAVSSNPLYRRWIAEPDPIHRWAVVADNLQEDVSPRGQLGFLKPSQPFAVDESKAGIAAAPAAFARYDAFTDAVVSINAAEFARVYLALHKVLEWTYRQLGYPSARPDVVAAQALGRIAGAPLGSPDGAAATLVRKGTIYLYADPKLEALGPIEKHLLRLGPRNARLVQGKARELQQALGLPEVKVAPR